MVISIITILFLFLSYLATQLIFRFILVSVLSIDNGTRNLVISIITIVLFQAWEKNRMKMRVYDDNGHEC